MKAITTIVLISILNGFQPQPVVFNTSDVAMSEIKKKKKGKKIKKKGKKKKKGFFSKFKGAK